MDFQQVPSWCDIAEQPAEEATRDELLLMISAARQEITRLEARLDTEIQASNRYEDLTASLDSAAYDHFKALGRSFRRGEWTFFGEFAELLPLELERLRFLMAPFHGESTSTENAWIQVGSREFYPLVPFPADVRIEDIASALSKICRFTGHTRVPYSVAEHAVRVSYQCPQPLRLRAVLHDASEFALADIPSPVKHSPMLSAYRKADQWLQKVIYLRFGIVGEDPPELKTVDRRMLATEARDLLPAHHSNWFLQYGEPYPDVIEPWPWEVAQTRFLDVFASASAGLVASV